MTGRMESVETPAQSKPSSNAQRRGFPTLPTVPWKSLRDSHIPTASTTTIFSYQQGDISTGLRKGTFLLGVDNYIEDELTSLSYTDILSAD